MLCRAPHINIEIIYAYNANPVAFNHIYVQAHRERTTGVHSYERIFAVVAWPPSCNNHYHPRCFSRKKMMTLFYRNHDEKAGKNLKCWNGSTNVNKPRKNKNNNLPSMSEWANQNSRVIFHSEFKSIIYAFHAHSPWPVCALFRTDGPKQIIKWQKVLKTRASNDKNSSLVFCCSSVNNTLKFEERYHYTTLSFRVFFPKWECDICKQ